MPLGCHPEGYGRAVRAQLVAGAFSSWPSLLWGILPCRLQVAFGSRPSPLGLLLIGGPGPLKCGIGKPGSELSAAEEGGLDGRSYCAVLRGAGPPVGANPGTSGTSGSPGGARPAATGVLQLHADDGSGPRPHQGMCGAAETRLQEAWVARHSRGPASWPPCQALSHQWAEGVLAGGGRYSRLR